MHGFVSAVGDDAFSATNVLGGVVVALSDPAILGYLQVKNLVSVHVEVCLRFGHALSPGFPASFLYMGALVAC